MYAEIMITDFGSETSFFPNVEEGIEWSTERRSAPGKLTFKVLKDSVISFQEGAQVRLTVDGKPVFFGFVFTKKRDREGIISVTAYDQLRYLKNKDTCVYEGKTASQLLQMLAEDFHLKVGTLEDTRFVIASRVEDNTTLLDMVENALDLTLQNTGEMFVLYDDFGKLTLKNISSLRVGGEEGYLVIDEETGENFDYTSTIDNDSYNQVKLVRENEEAGKRETFLVKDTSHINAWGLLQYYDTLKEGENGQAKAEALLRLYNHKTRNLKISNVWGDLRVRAGSMVLVNLNLGDMKLQNFMLVERAVHRFSLDEHTMELTLRGGEYIA